MVSYLSGVFNSWKKKYPKLDIWMWDTNRDNVPKWYVKLRNKIRRTVSSKVMEAEIHIEIGSHFNTVDIIS